MSRTSANVLSDIGDYVADFLPFLLDEWQAWKLNTGRPVDPGTPPGENMCGFTSAFLTRILEDKFGGNWMLAGGAPSKGGGVLCSKGTMRGHYWAQSEDGVIVDLTGEQFGHPSIIVTTVGDPRYHPVFEIDAIEEHLPRVDSVAHFWIEKATTSGLLHAAPSMSI